MREPRKLFVRPAVKPNADINVTPLVDVVLVLLIIFMVYTPLLEKDIDVRVPKTEEVQDVQEVPPDQLVVAVSPEGELSINMEKVPPAEYINRLKAVLDRKSEKLVFFMAADKANYAKVIAALDGARKAGATTLGMMTTPMPDIAPAPAPGTEGGAQPPGAPPSPGTPPGSSP